MTKTLKLICNLFKINGINYTIGDESDRTVDQSLVKVKGQAKEALAILGKIGNGNLARAGRSAKWQKGTSFLFMVIDANDEGTLDLGILDFSDTLENVVAILNELEIKYTTVLSDKDLQLKLEPLFVRQGKQFD
jgi:cell division septal protein FtsQ